jgi:hypothetical protein
MAFQLSVAVRNASLDAIETTIGTAPTLEIRSGLPPANAAAADTGTLLASMALPTDWLAAASAGAKGLLGTWQDPSADASGRGGHFRIKQGATCHTQGLVSDAWQASRPYAVNDQVTNGGNLYRATVAGTSASSGGPSGTGASIVDGGVTWTFVQVGADCGLDNATINAGQQVNITAFTYNAGGA